LAIGKKRERRKPLGCAMTGEQAAAAICRIEDGGYLKQTEI
jgi:hypothetical protein